MEKLSYVDDQNKFLQKHYHFPKTTLVKFVSDLRQVSGFLLVLWFPPPIKLTVMI